MTLSANYNAPSRDLPIVPYDVAASTTIYKGALTCINSSGYLVAGADTSGFVFAGIAEDQCDNSSGSAGDLQASVNRDTVKKLLFDSVSQGDVGGVAYVSDDATATTSSTNNIAIGQIVEYVDSTHAYVHARADRVQAGEVKHLTDADTDLYPMTVDVVRVVDIDDAGDMAILAAGTHPDMKLIGGRATLLEVPDSSAKTLTVQIFRTSDDADMTDELSFAEGTDAANDLEDFTVDGTDHTIEDDDAAYITVGGNSSTLGQALVRLTWQFSR